MNSLTPEQIVSNWANVVAPKIQPEKYEFVRTYGANKKLVALLPRNHRHEKWNRRRGGWSSKVPVISWYAKRVIELAILTCGK